MTIKKKTSNPLFIFIHLVYVVTKLLMRILQRNTHPSFACIIQNLFSVCIGSKSRFSFDTRERLYCVLDDNLKRYFSEMDRGFSSYERGVLKEASYCSKVIVCSILNLQRGMLLLIVAQTMAIYFLNCLLI